MSTQRSNFAEKFSSMWMAIAETSSILRGAWLCHPERRDRDWASADLIRRGGRNTSRKKERSFDFAQDDTAVRICRIRSAKHMPV